jgi:hypothetical protein
LGEGSSRHFRPALCHGARVAAAIGAIAVQRIEPPAQIDVVAAKSALSD